VSSIIVPGDSEFPFRTEVTVLNADPKKAPIGFRVYESVGISAYNVNALQSLLIVN